MILKNNFEFWIKHKSTILYGISLAFLLLFLKWLEIRMMIFDHSYGVYIGVIALLFMTMGIWVAKKLSKPKIERIIVEKEVYITKNVDFILNEDLASQLNLSQRELSILSLLGEGCSNQDISSKLFISISTVKSHNQNIFDKLDAKNRLQAVDKAKKMSLIP